MRAHNSPLNFKNVANPANPVFATTRAKKDTIVCVTQGGGDFEALLCLVVILAVLCVMGGILCKVCKKG